MSAKPCAVCGSVLHLTVIHSCWPMNALWYPPFGNLNPQQPASAARAAAPDYSQALKAHEDKVAEVLGNFSEAERIVAYKYLHATGIRVSTADQELRKAMRKELQGGSQ